MTESRSDTTPTRDEPVLGSELLAEMEERLLKERERAQEDLNTALEEENQPPASSSGELSDLPSHPADAASDAAEADRDFRVAERSTEHVNAIDDALHRLREHPEQYGTCEVGGETIDVERLRLVPWTRRCADHAAESEEVGASAARSR